jgi:hypothetical protein
LDKLPHHKKILVAQVREYESEAVKKDIDELITLAHTADNVAVVTKMKQMVPEFISNNSEFGKIDMG